MDADERARLRELAEQAVTCTEGVGNMLMDRRYRYYLEATPDVVLRLLDDVERADREVANRAHFESELRRERDTERARAEAAERELASVLSDWNAVRDAAGSKTNGGLAGHVAQLRARAERLEAALKPIAGWWKIWNAGGPTPDEWIVREWMQKADAALAEPAPAPGGQDTEREGGCVMGEADRYQPVQAGYWWRVKVGDGDALYGKFHSRRGAEEMCALLLREFRNGKFIAERAADKGA